MLLEKEGARYVRCPDCGLVYSATVPDERTLKEVAEDWARKHHASAERLEWEKQATVGDVLFGQRMKIINRYRNSGKLLDVGCSTGFFLEYAASHGWKINGSELSHYTATMAQERLGVEIKKGTFLEAEFQPGFDVVTMWDVIEHAPEPQKFLGEAFRVLRRGGLLALTTPNYDSLSRWVLNGRWEALCPPRHLVVFNTRTLKKMVEQVGGRVVLIRCIDVNPMELFAGLTGREIDFEGRQRGISTVKRAFSRFPALSYVRNIVNIMLTQTKLGDVIELYAERPT
jgi:2-polyprenyl-3-methyl-5-hydroxy-6-metoxy-1,4-benzoquinol methylase